MTTQQRLAVVAVVTALLAIAANSTLASLAFSTLASLALIVMTLTKRSPDA